MTTRVGRGEKVRQLLEAKRKEEEEAAAALRPGASSSTSAEPPSVLPQSTPPSVQTGTSQDASPPKPRGRGMLIQQKLAASLNKPGYFGNIPIPPNTVLPKEEQGKFAHETRTTLYNAPPTEPPSEQMSQLSIVRPPPQVVTFRGESGQTIPVMVNYLDIELKNNAGMYEYEVRFNPPVDSRGFRARLIYSMPELGKYKTFDGVILYLPHKLEQATTRTIAKSLEGTDIEVSVIFKRERHFNENVHFYNTLFRRIANILNLVQFKDCMFDPTGKMAIPEYKLEVWPGFVTAIDVYEGGLKLHIDTSSRVLRTNTCLDLIDEYKEKFGASYKEHATAALVGQVILTRYNNKHYRIDHVDFNQTPNSCFTKKDSEWTFVRYQKEQYNITIKDTSQPMLISKVTRKMGRRGGPVTNTEQIVAIVPELAFLTGLSEDMRNNFHCTKKLGEYTRSSPNQKLQFTRKFIENVLNTPESSALLDGWGLSLSRAFERINGRLFPSETIYMGRNVMCPGTREADWNREIAKNPALHVVNFDQWLLVHIKRDTRNAENFTNCLKRISGGLGIQVNHPQVISMNEETSQAYINALKKGLQDNTRFVVVIFNAARTDRYQDVKRFCCCERPIPSQVINSRTISREDKMKSIVMKIALQINCKLGGSLWSVKIPFDYSMVVGIDVYHEGAGGSGLSVVGIVTSTDRDYTSFYSQAMIQERGQEVTQSVINPFFKSLVVYFTKNRLPPKQIFIYRDGVSDGQLDMVLKVEVEQYQKTLDSAMKKYLDQGNSSPHYPKLTVIIVQKRINTKIFAIQGSGEYPKLDNPGPGTVVDYSVTRRSLKDFFLVSQHVRQGTVTPSHYIVLKDDNDCKVDHIQRLSYKLCHLYYNWPGTIRVPAPCQYAHRLAYLTGLHLRKLPSETLNDKLFFL